MSRTSHAMLGLKLQALKELSNMLRQRPHDSFEPNIIEGISIHKVIVNETDLRAMNETTDKIETLKKNIKKLKKKGKFHEAKTSNRSLLHELQEGNAIGGDLGKSTKQNEEVIKVMLEIYFDFLKNRPTSPLLKEVFINLPAFSSHVNITIVWDLINSLRDYVRVEKERKHKNVSNLIASLLCAF